VYHSSNLDHWNVWGTDNVGKINANGDKFFYIKDHLGSVRVVLNSDNQIVSAIDYDCWGYPLENRSYQSDGINYKFTGKQRDTETGYDYFGARYYDARIGRWGGVEPLLEKYISYSPYQYGLLNPMKLVDVNGKDVYILGQDSKNTVEYMNKEKENTGLTISIDETGKLSVEGKPLTQSARIVYNAITSDDYEVKLYTVQKDYLNDNDHSKPISVGAFMSNYEENGVGRALQYFNLPQAIAYNDAGGSSVAVSVFHEIKEAFIGAVLRIGFGPAHHLTKVTDPIGSAEPVEGITAEGKLYYNKITPNEYGKFDKVFPAYDSE